MRKSLIMAALAAALPFHMSDVTAAAAPGEDPNAGASLAADVPASDTTSSVTPAPADSATGTTGALPDDVSSSTTRVVIDPPIPVLNTADVADVTPAPTAPLNENTGKIEVAADSHAEAKERFAGLLSKLHSFESDSVEDLRAELLAIGTLLHLHSKASTDAALTGDYKASDLS